MKTSKDKLIKWIHIVEAETHLRLAAIITELYFSKKLYDALTLGHFSGISEGWIYTTQQSTNNVRYWIKLSNDISPSKTDIRFINHLGTAGHRFFYLSYEVFNPVTPDKPPTIKVITREAYCDKSNINLEMTPESIKLQSLISNLIENYLSGLTFTIEKPLSASDWLVNVGEEKLLNIFVQRCLLNSLGKLKPLDLDAIALDEGGENLIFLEFKKKYPTAGSNRPKSPKKKPDDYYAFANTILTDALSIKNLNTKEKFSKAFNNRGFSYRRIAGYGLDLPHFETILLCERAHIEYRYVIWNEGNIENKQDRRLEESLSELREVLGYDLHPKSKPKWWIRSLKPADVDGLTYTFGYDSGSYSKKARMQVVFDAEKKQ
ncbi:hypothetical protein [Pseudomonas sp. NPDC012596]|uniref:hypothetical protein n=1 Tax=Pseudomonas sp. NPDC012596 TaxID=3364419 RepID=UPI0036ACEEF7